MLSGGYFESKGQNQPLSSREIRYNVILLAYLFPFEGFLLITHLHNRKKVKGDYD